MNQIEVNIKNEQNIFKIDVNKLKKITCYVLEKEGVHNTEVSILLTNDAKIRDLNRQYRNEDGATDVLAFPQGKSKEEVLNSKLLGDVVISVERAKIQADKFNQPILKEIYLYLIHGLLHLLGYKDERKDDYQKINKRQRELLNKIWKEED